MSVKQRLPEDDVFWVNDYAARVLNAFRAEFEGAGDRFKGSRKLLRRFTSAVDAVRTNGWSKFDAVDSAHNELCIASSILSMTEPVVDRLEYEPPLVGCARTIDFRATYGAVTAYVDVKTIAPKLTDRWDQFVKFESPPRRFPDGVVVVYEEDWLGGELWHYRYASRARMLEHTLGLERKISDGNLAAKDKYFVLALCGHEYHWRQTHLEDFVSFYKGSHWPGDPFGVAEAKYFKDRHLAFSGVISRFACMFRPRFGFEPRMNWRVEPPKISWE